MDYKLKNKNVLVTAASSGIGKSIAQMFVNEGANVAICSSNLSNIENAANEIYKSTKIKPFFLVCDINKAEDINDTVEKVLKKFGTIDILINNCGGPAAGFFNSLDDEQWQHAFEQVLMSAVRFTRLCLPYMKNKKWGRIINVTSLSVKQPVDNLILSNTFRSGLTAFAKTISNQLGEYNITVNNVAPGFTLTGRLEHLAEIRAKENNFTAEEILQKMANDVPLKRLGHPDELASLVVYLASDLAGYINGQTITVDGGLVKATY